MVDLYGRRLIYSGENFIENGVPLQKIWLSCKIRKKPSQLGKLIIFIRKKMTHKDENYSVKLQK